MRELELKLIPGSTTDTAATLIAADAWWIAGEDVETWFNLLGDRLSASQRLRFLPVSDADRVLVGALVSGVDGDMPSGCLPYRMVADCCFVPMHSGFSVPHSEEELRSLLQEKAAQTFVWHPRSGFVGFEPEQVLTVSDLLTVSDPTTADWSHAEPGLLFRQKLNDVIPMQTMTTEMVIESGRDDIGRDADDIENAPRSPDESQSAFKLRKYPILPAAKLAQWLANKTPATSAAKTWINSVESWANSFLEKSGTNQTKRLNEMQRLITMLDRDPDAGLRYAIPFGGDASRGVVQGGDELVADNFSFSGAGRSRPASHWQMPWEIQKRLREQYIQLAQREISLGRYLRAAHIYYQLLGEYDQAARVLRKGGLYREAAKIYEDKLNQPEQAAACLREGGVWSEAVLMYEALGKWQQVAEIYDQMGDATGVRRAWEKAIEERLSQGDYITAAEYQREELKDPAAAEVTLRAGWDQSSQPMACLGILIELLRDQQRHDDVKQRLAEVSTDSDLAEVRQQDIGKLLANQANSYPDPGVRRESFLLCRQLVSRHIKFAGDRRRNRFTPILKQLIPNDRLMNQDCRRFLRDSGHKYPPLKRGQVLPMFCVQLQSDVTWQTAIRNGRYLFVCGYQNDELVIASWKHSSDPEIAYDRFQVREERQGRILLLPSVDDSRILLHVVGASLHLLYVAPDARSSKRVEGASFRPQTVDAVLDEDGNQWTLGFGLDGLEICGLHRNGHLIHQTVLPLSEIQSNWNPRLQVFRDIIVCSVFDFVLIKSAPTTEQNPFVVDTQMTVSQKEEELVEPALEELLQMAGEVRGVSGFHRINPRIAVSLDDGGQVQWLPNHGQQSFGTGLNRPVTAFMGNEDLIAADEHGKIEIYATRHFTLTLKCRSTADAGEVAAVLPLNELATEYATEFILVRKNGSVESFGYHG